MCAQQVAVSVSDMPEFTGGTQALYEYMQLHLTYPAGSRIGGIHGYVYVQFVVTRDGEVKDVELLQGVSKQLDSISINAVRSMPRWIPGRNGKSKAEVRLGAGFDFQLKDSTNHQPKLHTGEPRPFFTAIATQDGTIFCETKAQFPGGETALQEFIRKNEKYPVKIMRQGIQGTVYVQFEVDTTGTVSDAKLRSTLVDELDNEALRVISIMPRWKPATMNGQPIKSAITVPIRFYINQEAY